MKVTDHDFVDDVVILFKPLETPVVTLDAIRNKVKPFSLGVSWTITKVQDFRGSVGNRDVLAGN